MIEAADSWCSSCGTKDSDQPLRVQNRRDIWVQVDKSWRWHHGVPSMGFMAMEAVGCSQCWDGVVAPACTLIANWLWGFSKLWWLSWVCIALQVASDVGLLTCLVQDHLAGTQLLLHCMIYSSCGIGVAVHIAFAQ